MSDVPIMHANNRAALAAAHGAAEASAELLRYIREGECAAYAFDNEPVEKLADALRTAASIEREAMAGMVTGRDEEGMELLDRLAAACSHFLEGWA